MSKRMKKLIGLLLSMAMTVSSVGVIALADEADTKAADPTATVAPVATEDPDATPEPTDAAIDEPDVEDEDSLAGTATAAPAEEAIPEPTEAPKPVNKYANDAYYQRSLALVTALGIFKGDENGSMNENSNVTRAEMAAIVLRMLNTPANGPYQGGFNDVKADHWAANEIQTAQSLGIINGFEDGSFRPDGNVTYEQVVKMIVCALGYEREAKFNGGYPNGYISKANSLELTDNAYGVVGEASERGLVIKMAYNALLTLYNEVVSVDAGGYNVYDATKTLAKAKFNVIDANGVLTATSNKTIDQSYSDLQDGLIVVDGTTYTTELTGLEDFVGTEVTYFYRKDNAAITAEILAVSTKKSSKTDKIVVNLDNVRNLTGFDTNEGVIVMDKGSNYRCPNAVVNYNGAVITAADYNRAVRNDEANIADGKSKFLRRDYAGVPEGNTVADAKSFNEFLLPDMGSIEITDLDGDGKYDYVFIESYETMLVTSVSSKTLAGKINTYDRTFDVNVDNNQDLKLTVTRGGSEVRARNLNTNDVASVMQSLDGNTLKIVVTGENVTGSVSSIGEEDNDYVAVINGDTYVIDPNAVENVATGSEGTFYLDMFGRVGYATSSGGGRLSGNEKYGWLMNAYKDEDGTTYKVKIFTQDGKAETFELASNVSYWGASDNDPSSLSGNGRDTIATIVSRKDFTVTSHGKQIRLCKFRANASGLVNMLYMARSSKDENDNRAVIIDTKNLRGSTAVGTTVGGHTIADGITGFNVPDTPEDMNSDSEFSAFKVTSSAYVSTSSGIERDFIVGEFTNTRDANVLIQYNTSANVAASINDYGTAADNPVMMVTGVDIGVDANGDDVYYIVGRRNGADVSYATTANTALYRTGVKAFYEGSGGTATYPTVPDGKPIWDATENTDSIAKYLRAGDIIGVKADATGAHILIKFVDVKELAERATNPDASQFLGYGNISESRDAYGVGAVSAIDTSGDTYFNITDPTGSSGLNMGWYFDSALAIDVVDVTTDDNGKFVSSKVSKDVFEPSEMMNYNKNTGFGDFVFFRHFRYQAQREAFIFRFNDN